MSTGDGRADAGLVRSEEELQVGVVSRRAGVVRAHKQVDVERVEQLVDRRVEHAEIERVAPLEGDSGEVETLADGSISIPVLEERLVVEKRLVVRERIIIRKQAVVEQELVEADLKKERVVLEAEDADR